MPRGDKSKYSDKQKRQAEHIAAGYEERGLGEREAKRRAWSTVNKSTGGGKMPGGSGRGKRDAAPNAPAAKKARQKARSRKSTGRAKTASRSKA